MSDQVEPFVILGKRISEAAEALGLQMAQYVVVPNLEGGTHQVHCLFEVDLEAVMLDPEDKLVRDQFQQVLESAAQAEADQRLEDVRAAAKATHAKIQSNLDNGKGILDD